MMLYGYTLCIKHELCLIDLIILHIQNTDEKNECNSSPCYNGGRCEDDVRGFKCICTPGHYGELCQFGR